MVTLTHSDSTPSTYSTATLIPREQITNGRLPMVMEEGSTADLDLETASTDGTAVDDDKQVHTWPFAVQ